MRIYARFYLWDASANVQCATFMSNNKPLWIIMDRLLAFDSPVNAFVPPYLELELEVDGDFNQCAWESMYSPIRPVHRARSLVRIKLWITGTNNG
jgi:hypothetical protein